MPISKFTIGASRTINLGNFESLRIEASITMDVPQNEKFTKQDNDALYGKLEQDAQVELRKLLEDTYRQQAKTKDRKTA